MSLVGSLIMVIAGLGAVVGLRQMKAGAAWGRPMAIGCTLLVLVLAVVGIGRSAGSGNRVEKTLDRYSYACGEVLGRHLAETFSGSRALVLLPPSAQGSAESSLSQTMEAQLEGLKSGMGSALALVNAVPIEPPDAFLEQFQSMGLDAGSIAFEVQNYRMWFDARSLAGNLARHKGTYDVAISLVGLPEDLAGSKLAGGQASVPAIAALNVSSHRHLEDLVKRGVVDAVVVHKPVPEGGWEDALKVPSDTAEAFAKRYVLVTPGNVEDVSGTYSLLFE